MIKVICNQDEKEAVAELLLNELTTMNLEGICLPQENFDDVKRIISNDENMKVYLTDDGVMTNISSTEAGFLIIDELTGENSYYDCYGGNEIVDISKKILKAHPKAIVSATFDYDGNGYFCSFKIATKKGKTKNSIIVKTSEKDFDFDEFDITAIY